MLVSLEPGRPGHFHLPYARALFVESHPAPDGPVFERFWAPRRQTEDPEASLRWFFFYFIFLTRPS